MSNKDNKITYVNEENIKKVPVAKAVVKGINGLKNYLLKYLGAGTAIYALLGSAGQKTFNFFISQLTVDIARMSQAEIFGVVARVLGGINAVLPGAVIAVPLMVAGGLLFSVKMIVKAATKKGKVSSVDKSKVK